MINVLYIIDSMFYAGAQTHIAGMIRGHDKNRFRPYLICLQEKGPLGKELEAEGYPVAAYGLKRVYALQAAWSYTRFIPFLRRERIDIVHAYLFSAQIYGIPPSRLAGVPLVIAGRRESGKYWTALRYILARKFANSFSHIQIANAQAVKEFVVREERVRPDKVKIVANGIDASRFSPIEGSTNRVGQPTLTIGYVGSLTRVKQVEVLLRAAKRILPACPRLRVRIVGGGPAPTQRLREGRTDAWLRTIASQLGLGDHVDFTGARTEVLEELREMDIFVMPSILEGMSNAILEAMATGLPVIATDSGGNRELVDEGGTGYLFPVGDDQRLGELILDLLGSEEKRRAMGRAARQRVMERFTVQRMVAEMERVYTEELARINEGES